MLASDLQISPGHQSWLSWATNAIYLVTFFIYWTLYAFVVDQVSYGALSKAGVFAPSNKSNILSGLIGIIIFFGYIGSGISAILSKNSKQYHTAFSIFWGTVAFAALAPLIPNVSNRFAYVQFLKEFQSNNESYFSEINVQKKVEILIKKSKFEFFAAIVFVVTYSTFPLLWAIDWNLRPWTHIVDPSIQIITDVGFLMQQHTRFCVFGRPPQKDQSNENLSETPSGQIV